MKREKKMTQLQNKAFNLRRVKNVNIIEMYKNENARAKSVQI